MCAIKRASLLEEVIEKMREAIARERNLLRSDFRDLGLVTRRRRRVPAQIFGIGARHRNLGGGLRPRLEAIDGPMGSRIS